MVIIEEDYVSFETAKLLKDKGFDEPTMGTYYKDGAFENLSLNKWNSKFITPISAPTLQMAMKWLREVHNLFINVYYDSDFCEGFRFSVNKLPKGTTLETHNENYSNYELACEAAIKYCLEHLI